MLPVLASPLLEEDMRYLAYQCFGDLIGFAFQIQDDILDQIATTEELGKTAGKDSAQNKMTFPHLIGLHESEQRVQQLGQEAINILKDAGCFSDDILVFIQALLGRKA
jgi:geranylgeranyl pyrophosphate synthase